MATPAAAAAAAVPIAAAPSALRSKPREDAPPHSSSASPHASGSAAPAAATPRLSPASPSPHGFSAYHLAFEAGNPSVELITGRIALARRPPTMREESDDDDLSGDEDGTGPQGSEVDTETETDEDDGLMPQLGTNLVCVFDIPAHLTLNELHDFLLDAEHLVHVQLTRIPSRRADSTYSALLQFRTPAAAAIFVADYDGVAYNSLEPDVCVARFVLQVFFDDDKYSFPVRGAARGTGAATPIPHLTLGKSHSREAPSPLIKAATPRSLTSPLVMSASSSSLVNLPSLSLTPCQTPALGAAADPSASLPSCPVCLEAISPSSTSPMLTILCNHVFHFDCLSKWIPSSSSSSSCPVCRYMMQPNVHTQCSTCKATDKLWLCILCGHVGCSRYALGHAHQHFEQTSHNYAIEVLTQRVWDYTADCYVHRLVRNKTDGKLVELSRVRTLDDDPVMSEHATPTKSLSGASLTTYMHGSPAGVGGTAAAHPASAAYPRLPSPAPLVIQPSSSAYASVKLEEYLLEYNYLLSSQLDQQRRIFQHALHQGEADMTARRGRLEKEIEHATTLRDDLQTKVAKARGAHTENTSQLQNLHASHASLTSQSAQLSSLHAKLVQGHSSAQAALNASSAWYTQQQESIVREQDTTIASLEEQIHDLAFFLDTQKKIDKMDSKSRRGGNTVGLKQKLQSGQASLELVEVAPSEDEAKGRRKRR